MPKSNPIRIEVDGSPGQHTVLEAAKLIGVACPTLWYHVHHGDFGDWFAVKGKRARVVGGNDRAGNPVGILKLATTGGDRGKLESALQRGCEFSTDSDVRVAMGWLSRARRVAEDLKLVMAGKADLQIDYRGDCIVVHQVEHKPAKFQEPAPATEYEGAMAQRA